MVIGKIPREMVVRIGWTTTAFGTVQVLRFANNVILARLLSPPLLGLMLIVNSIRTGVELLSDVGINQNIVSNRQGHTPEFYDTAWSIMAIRGVVLGAACFALAGFFARFFDKPELGTILPVIALTFLFTGFQSASSALLQKQGSVARISAFEVGVAVISLAAHVALALITPTIWALVLGSVVTSAAALVASYLIIPGVRHRFIIDRASAREILFFGKWIFLSSIIYFLAMNYDRLYFAKQIPLALLGVYRNRPFDGRHADKPRRQDQQHDPLPACRVDADNRAGRAGKTPPSASDDDPAGRGRARPRSSQFPMSAIRLLYDSRYETAAEILPLLLLGVWLAVLCRVNDSVLLGMAKPRLHRDRQRCETALACYLRAPCVPLFRTDGGDRRPQRGRGRSLRSAVAVQPASAPRLRPR